MTRCDRDQTSFNTSRFTFNLSLVRGCRGECIDTVSIRWLGFLRYDEAKYSVENDSKKSFFIISCYFCEGLFIICKIICKTKDREHWVKILLMLHCEVICYCIHWLIFQFFYFPMCALDKNNVCAFPWCLAETRSYRCRIASDWQSTLC